MKLLLKYIAAWWIIMIQFYLLFAWFQLEWNIVEWHDIMKRVFMVAAGVMCLLIFPIGMELFEKKSN